MTLRLKYLLASLAVVVVLVALLLLSSLRLLDRELRQQADLRIRQFGALADATLNLPLARQDLPALQQALRVVQQSGDIRYLVVLGPQQQVLASVDWDERQPLPPPDASLATLDIDRPGHTWHAQRTLVQAGQPLGSLRFGVATDFLLSARRELLLHTLPVAAGVLLLGALLLAVVGRVLTRQLTRLQAASAQLSGGDYQARVEVLAPDDLGRLAQSFNTMAAATQQRLQQLQAGEQLQRQTLASVQAGQARLHALLEAMDSGILFIDGDERVFYANAAFLRTWRLSPALVPPGRALADLVTLMRSQLDDEAQAQQLLGRLPSTTARCELHMLDQRVLLQRVQRVEGGATGVTGRLVIHEDVTAERRMQSRAQRADRDMLTDLPNRRGLLEALAAAVADGGVQGSELALFFIDLDDFKYTNDTFGHRLGDDLLRTVSRALVAAAQPGWVVARIGGDEFAVLCPGVGAAEGQRIAPRLVQAVSGLQVDARGHELRLGCSVGLAVFPEHAPSADSLMVCADLAMYEAKRSGKNGWAIYRHDAERTHSESAHLRWNARITRAIDEGRFCLQFQPVHHADGAGVAHYEALLRLPAESDDSVLLAPGEFVPYAERSGRIRPIDRWVLGECVRALARAPQDVRVAANLSARSIDDRSLPDHVAALLAEHGVHASRLLIEITETSTIGDPRAAGEMIARLRALGCSVHLDDFGAGFASFAHLKLLAVDGIKIDGSYVRGLVHDDENRVFVAAMVAVARALQMTTVAEHVEDGETLSALRGMGVDLVQGFLLGRPGVPAFGHAPASNDAREARARAGNA